MLPVLLALACAGPAWAQSGAAVSDMIGWAEAAETELEYERALELWNTVIAHPDVTQQQRLQASVHAGSIERIRGNALQARVHFMYVLREDIDYRLPPHTEPKITAFFEMIRSEVRNRDGAAQSAPAAAAAVGTSAPEDQRARSGGEPGVLLYAGGAVLGAAALLGALATSAGLLSNQAHAAAMQSAVQTDRVAHYDERDLLAGLASGGWIAAGTLLVVGSSLLVIELVSAEEAP